MRIIVVIFVILNNLVWFFASIGGLNNFLKGVMPVPTKPTMVPVILSFVLLLMNAVVLFFILRKTNDEVSPRREVNMKNFFIGLGWFVIIYFVSSFITGMVIGAIAGSSTTTPAAGAEAGRISSINFFHKYGGFFFLGSALAAIIGTIKGWLPFTKDEK